MTWRLPEVDVSADWAQGANALWFVPHVPERRDRFGLALDLSRWMESLVPGTSPELAMRWDWSRALLPGETPENESSLPLDVAVLF